MGTARLLVVAGLDPSGAGIDADRDAAAELALDVLCVVTAHTEQDERGVRAIGARAPHVWLEEALALVGERPAAIKLGLLPGADHVRAALALVHAARTQLGAALPIVVDPVIAASSGTRFLDRGAVHALGHELVAADIVLTPNLSEAAELSDSDPAALAVSIAARIAAARVLLERGARAVVLKGGHGDEDPVQDLLLERGREPVPLVHARLRGVTLRGTGCRFATFLAGGLARGLSLDEAVGDAGRRVASRLARA